MDIHSWPGPRRLPGSTYLFRRPLLEVGADHCDQLSGLVLGSSPKSTPPDDNSFGGLVDGVAYSYRYWEEGLAILIWQDLSYGTGETCSGTGSTEDPVYRLECNVDAPDGRSFGWKVNTSDGVTGEMWIGERSFDLSKGTMFLVSIGEVDLQVEQLQRDLSGLDPSIEAISTLADSEPDVANFISGREIGSD